MTAFSMETLGFFLTALSTLLWVGFALQPWRPWSNCEVVDAVDGDDDEAVLREITVVIPARNEAEVIQQTLQSVIAQGAGLKIVLIDDNSEDTTVEKVRAMQIEDLRVLRTPPLPAGWSGKLWALEQGRRQVTTPYTLLLDADIKLDRGIVRTLRERMVRQDTTFISLLAAPSMFGCWEKLLMPAFVYFFKILYPFTRVNAQHSSTAAAAGGCILVESRLLDQIGGFESVKLAVIDDCALARQVKSQGFKVWLGLTHSVNSIRSYQGLKEIWDMVARTAFVQLHCSVGLLILCTLLMFLAYEVPVVMVFSSNLPLRYFSLLSLAIMFFTYIPTLRFYRRSWAWAFGLPFIAVLFLAMTWTSAIRYWQGERTRWKGRIYRREGPAVEISRKQEHRLEP